MGCDRQAPDEPAFADVLEHRRSSPDVPEWVQPDEPEREIPVREPAEGAKRPPHAAIEALEELRSQGQRRLALHGFEALATRVARLDRPSLDEQIVWLQATRRAFETATELDEPDRAIAQLERNASTFRSPAWSQQRETTHRYYWSIIELSLRFGRDREALEIYRRVPRALEPEPDLKRKLIEAAVRVGHRDAITARLCIEGLAERLWNESDREPVVRLVRGAIRIELDRPGDERLSEYAALNVRMREVEDLAWVAANLAMVAFREGRLDDALDRCSEAGEPEDDDATSRVLLAIVFYCARRWKRAIALLDRALEIAGDSARPHWSLYRRLCRVNLLFEESEKAGGRADFLRQLESELDGGQPDLSHDDRDLNAAWVFGTSQFLLGRDDEAIELFERAPPRHATWQHALAQVHSLVRAGQRETAQSRLRDLEAARPDAALLIRLLFVRMAIDQLDWDDAELFFQAAEQNEAEFVADDADLTTARDCLAAELALSQPEPLLQSAPSFGFAAETTPSCPSGEEARPPDAEVWPGDLVQWTSAEVDQFAEPRRVIRLSDDGQRAFVEGSETGLPTSELTVVRQAAASTRAAEAIGDVGRAGVSASVRAWARRLESRWRRDRGELGAAETLLNEPLQFVAPEAEIRRLQAVQRAFTDNASEEAGARFEHLATVPSAQPIDRLHWGLWLCGLRRHQEALSALEGCPDCLESELARAECFLADASTAERAREILTSLSERCVWQTARRAAEFRPWHGLVSPDAWGLDAEVSMHRISDMLHAADLMIDANLHEVALETVTLACRLVGDEHLRVASVRRSVGQTYQHAARAQLELQSDSADQSHLLEACRLEEEATSLGVEDADFAVRLATAVSGDEFAPDAVLQVLCRWVVKRHEDGSFQSDAVVVCAVERFLFINDETPVSSDEVARRERFTVRLRDECPKWDWPWRNMARAHHRRREHEHVIECVAAIQEPTREDLCLRGQACWSLGRFDEAAEVFEAADEVGWVGCARAAETFRRMREEGLPLTEEEAETLCDALNWNQCDALLAPMVRAWHGAVLVAARLGARALDVLDVDQFPSENELRGTALLLRGLALLLCGRRDEALQLWTPADEGDSPADRQRVALRMLVIVQHANADQRAEVVERARQMRQRGVKGEAFHLVEAQLALLRGEPDAARRSAAAAAESADGDLLLAPLCVALEAEHDFVHARLAMHDGDFQAAAERLESSGRHRFWSGAEPYWRAVCLGHLGDVEGARSLLSAMVEQEEAGAAAHAQLAMIFCRQGQWDKAQAHAERSLELEPAQPFALLAMGHVHEGRQDRAAASRCYEVVVGQKPGVVGPRAAAVARLALGRLAQAGGHLADAEDSYRRAVELEPDGNVPKRRLGLVLVLRADSQDQLARAEDLLIPLAEAEPDDVAVALAVAHLACELEKPEEECRCLQRLIAMEGFARLPKELRRQLARWSADVQIRLSRYDAAAEAYERIVADDPSPKAREDLLKCRMLQAVQLVKQKPMPADGLERVLQAAEAVCLGRLEQPEPAAVLLRALCRVLLGALGDDQRQPLLVEVKACQDRHPEMDHLACLVRFLAGDGQEAVAEWLAGLGDGHAACRRGIELLAANLRGDVSALSTEAERLAGPGDEPGRDAIPFQPEDVVLVGALRAAGARKPDEACHLLRSWHGRHPGTRRSLVLQSQLLAKQASKSIKKTKGLQEARQLLAEAVMAHDAAASLSGDVT